MIKFLEKNERDFNVCSDCIYFIFENIIDPKYPKIVEGTCKLHDGIKDNRWETTCKDCTADCTCKSCVYCDGNFCECHEVMTKEALADFADCDKQICNNFEKID